MLRRAVLVAALAAVAVPSPAPAAPRVATTSEGVRLVLEGRAVALRVPAGVGRGSAIVVRCGVGVTVVEGARRAGVRSGARVRVRLERALPQAEWCSFSTLSSKRADGPQGAGTLQPRLAPAPPPVRPGAEVRSGKTGERAAFHLAGRTLTVDLARPFRRSTVVLLSCFPAGDDEGDVPRATAAVGHGRRRVTAVLAGGDIGSARECALLDLLDGGSEVASADLGAPPGPLQTFRLQAESMYPRLDLGARVVFDLNAYATAPPAVGDIVIFRPPRGAVSDEGPQCGDRPPPAETELCTLPSGGPAPERIRFITRVVAVGGDRVGFRDGRVVRNGVVEQRRGLRPCGAGTGCTFANEITVPAGHVYVAGDNRGASDDSRFYGAVPVPQVLGRYVRELRPPRR